MEMFKRLPDDSVDCVLTDIPYNEVNHSADLGGDKIRVFHKGFADELTFDVEEFCREVYRVARKNIIMFTGFTLFSTCYSVFKLGGYKDLFIRAGVWEKTNPSPVNAQHFYASGIESIVLVKKKGGTFNAPIRNTVFRFPTGSSSFHPTEKNHDLLKKLIEENTNTGDLILDPCAGSGSTCLVAYQNNRNFIGFELNEEMAEKARERLLQNQMIAQGMKHEKSSLNDLL